MSYCVILASEAINLIDRRQYGGNVVMKVDIKNVFDTFDRRTWQVHQIVTSNIVVSLSFSIWTIIQLNN